MLKIRLNLRKVATIVVCLAVTTAFSGCGNGGGDDDGGSGGGSGNSDTNLVGKWQALVLYSSINSWTSEIEWKNALAVYSFNKDGTFEYAFYKTSWGEKYTGKYTVTKDKVSFKEMKGYWFRENETEDMKVSERDYWEVTMDYELGSDKEGKYIITYVLHADKNYTPRADWGAEYKFRIVK